MKLKLNYKKAVNINKNNFICYNELGNVYLNEFNFINSKYYFKKAIEIFLNLLKLTTI